MATKHFATQSFPVGNPDRLGAGEGSGLLTSILVCAVDTQKHDFSTDSMIWNILKSYQMGQKSLSSGSF
ncbi:hypothetical protein AALO_G00016900 [Alosa alosa]|uniref:Uncharacterized protein n=1 Tax=Alosa alosa TaxID=278164 RepID=A0AAV6HMI3_9TELE|nr:hypothetical protein AALO_G00016900 [Alosa alosa]